MASDAITVAEKPGFQPAGALSLVERLGGLLARELAPSPRKFRITLRIALIGTVGAGLIAACHVHNELGTYIVWLLVGAGPMMSFSNAATMLAMEGLALAASLVMARIL